MRPLNNPVISLGVGVFRYLCFFGVSFGISFGISVSGVSAVEDAEALALAPESPSAELQRYLARYPGLAAGFVQITYDKSREIIQEVEGSLWVSTPDRFRIESGVPASQVLVSDGSRFWNYDADLEQVIISELDVSRIPILLLARHEEDIGVSYRVDSFSDESSHVFVLSPKSADSLFISLNLEFVDEKPVALLVRDNIGQTTHIVFESVESLANADDEIFSFTPPSGIDVIEE